MSRGRRRIVGENQKTIVELLDGLTGRYPKWQVWQDFIVMSATAIASLFDSPYRESREKLYMERAGKYAPDEADTFSKMLAETVLALEDNADQDFLGDLFMALELGDEWKGQFFTPYNVSRMMAEMTYGDDLAALAGKRGWVSVNDPACGAGSLLIAFANVCRRRGINYQTSVLFIAQDIDFLAGCMCYIQLSILGCPGYVVVGNSLSDPSTTYDGRGLLPTAGENVWYTPMYFRDVWDMRKAMAKLDMVLSRERIQQAREEAPPITPAKPEAVEQMAFSEGKHGQLILF